jgi:hypothetical protein
MAVEIANVINCMAMIQITSEDDFRIICAEGVKSLERTTLGAFVLTPENTLDVVYDEADHSRFLRYNTVPQATNYLDPDHFRVVVGSIPQNNDIHPGAVAFSCQTLNDDDVWVNIDEGLVFIQVWQFPTQK